jgi:maltose alpha-D-glucosyltransferase/alpha-amylase
MPDSKPLWYKDAIIYQLHVKAFFDSNDDGIGDFNGLIQKLDYIQNLGVTAIWLLPFYPSPLRDDGYDIADYRNIHPNYGTMADFRKFVREVHHRGMRLITELVINHTSDQHPWFKRAREAKPGSNHRNFYVWSDTDQRYLDTRIIFVDSEKSNWSWDPVAGAYYWHRFYSHQPDLNFDNPAVFRVVVQTMKFWLEAGVDGLRLDAVPYLCERDGTNNENLPETHDILKRLRAAVDADYPDRMLLAEANQWPEDVRPYFGDGDECHMAFHFPLMPRIYMAVAQEDRHPITDIMRQTPDIPENCQWAIFLRNHDELTLEMVTDRERDYLWTYYASDSRMRINLGIRRRLAPLMDNDRAKIDLLNSLLLSMPGTPVLYYGDEIGMGDNVYLGDRDGVRTPMQWSLDRNGGFSRADAGRLYLPAVQDPVYGFPRINVEVQGRSVSSLLNATRRLIAARQTLQAFGQGSLTFLYPTNRKILAYVRRYRDQIVLCVVNISRSAQPVELDLSAYKGLVPVELLSGSAFPIVSDRPYAMTMQGYGFFWFSLLEPAQAAGTNRPADTELMPEFVTLVSPKSWEDLLKARNLTEISDTILPQFLPKQRWFGAKDRMIASIAIGGTAILKPSDTASADQEGWLLSVIDVGYRQGEAERYLLPFGMRWGSEGPDALASLLPQTLAKVRRSRNDGSLIDAASQAGLTQAILRNMKDGSSIPFLPSGDIRFAQTSAFADIELPETLAVTRLGGEQSNSSALVGDLGVLKLYRRLQTGIHPEIEMGRYLVETAKYTGAPPLLGTIELCSEAGDHAALGVLSSYVANQGDAWQVYLDYVRRSFEDSIAHGRQKVPHDPHIFFLTLATQLGRRTASLHRALCPDHETDPAFEPEAITVADLTRWSDDVKRRVDETSAAIERKLASADADDATVEKMRLFVASKQKLYDQVDRVAGLKIRAMKTRIHGDLHLGQVLVVKNDFMIIDFEGEPRRSFEERRQKHTPLKDVAGMIRSIDYAAAAALRNADGIPSADRAGMEDFCNDWRRRTEDAFLSGYREEIEGSRAWPSSDGAAKKLLDLLILEKALYEIGYELANRPAWLTIPIDGVLRLLGSDEGERDDAAA